MRRLATVLVGCIVIVRGANLEAGPKRSANVDAAQKVFRALRAGCNQSGAALRTTVAGVFQPEKFGEHVVDGWKQLTDDQRATFVGLADRVVGAARRSRAIKQTCGRIDETEEGVGDVVRFRTRSDELGCADVVFVHDASDDSWHWGRNAECFVPDDWQTAWRQDHGRGDYAKAVAYLRAAARRPAR